MNERPGRGKEVHVLTDNGQIVVGEITHSLVTYCRVLTRDSQESFHVPYTRIVDPGSEGFGLPNGSLKASAVIEGITVSLEGGPSLWRVTTVHPVLAGAVVAVQDCDKFSILQRAMLPSNGNRRSWIK